MSKRRRHKRRKTNPSTAKPRDADRASASAPRETSVRDADPASASEPRHRERPRTQRRAANAPRSWMWRELAPFVGPAAVVAVYAIVRLVYIELSDNGGVLTPNGSVDGALAALALATFLLRMLTLIVVPFVVVYRLIVRILGPRARRASEPARGAGEP